MDHFPLAPGIELDEFIQHDLNEGVPAVSIEEYDFVLMLDVIEHLLSPEQFVDNLKNAARQAPNTTFIISTGNVGFLIARIMLLFGQFNYGKRGILDITHTRLFTFGTLRRLFEQAGFDVVETKGLPAPFPLALGDNWFARLVLKMNDVAIKLWKSAFAYQIYMTVRPRPSLESLLDHAYEQSQSRVEENRADVQDVASSGKTTENIADGLVAERCVAFQNRIPANQGPICCDQHMFRRGSAGPRAIVRRHQFLRYTLVAEIIER